MQATDAFTLAREADDLVQWLEEKMAVASSGETGKDYEHVELLLKSFKSVKTDVNSKDGTVKGLLAAAEQMMQTCDPALAPTLAEKMAQLQKTWDGLGKVAQQREKVLVASLEVEKFNREIDETRGWISSKRSVLPEDLGGDLDAVRQYQRKQDGFEADLEVLQAKVRQMEAAAGTLSQLHPAKKWKVAAARGEVIDTWNKLKEKTEERKQRLRENFTLQVRGYDLFLCRGSLKPRSFSLSWF